MIGSYRMPIEMHRLKIKKKFSTRRQNGLWGEGMMKYFPHPSGQGKVVMRRE